MLKKNSFSRNPVKLVVFDEGGREHDHSWREQDVLYQKWLIFFMENKFENILLLIYFFEKSHIFGENSKKNSFEGYNCVLGGGRGVALTNKN